MTSDEAIMLGLDPPPPGDVPAASVITSLAPPPGGLTARERQVVALITSGLSNNAIAAELVISPATTARHVANILAKLGFTSRAQIAAWAAGQHLDTVQPPRSRT
jgi:DNA-binding NarL/FixJ family response regulator